MAVNPISSPLPADLPTNWQTGQTVAPNGSDVGLAQQYGYNYQSQQINAAQQAINTIGAQFPNLYGKGDTVPIANGGTGGTSVAAALANLGAQPGFNLLVNSRFKYNGRNRTTYTGAAWTVDGWRSSANLTVDVVANGVTISSSNTSSISFFQYIKYPTSELNGKTITCSISDSDKNISILTLTLPQSYPETSTVVGCQETSWGKISVNAHTDANATAYGIATAVNNGQTVTLTAAKLELGSVSTLAADLATAQDETIEQLRLDMYDLDPGRPAWVLTQNQNLLDNWYFVGGGSQQGGGQFPINQRGQTSYTGAGYGIDRWEGGASLSVSLQLEGIYISSAGSSGISFTQYVPNLSNGISVTFSVLTKEYGVFTVYSKIPNEPPTENQTIAAVATPFGRMSIVFRQSKSVYSFSAIVSNGKAVTPLAAKLEIGPRSTLARLVNGQWVLNDPPPNFEQELAKCRRHQNQVFINTRAPLLPNAIATSVTAGCVTVPLPVTMRVAPTVTITNLSLAEIDNGNVKYPITGYNIARFDSGFIKINLQISGGGITKGELYAFSPTDDERSSLLLDANL